MNSIVVLLPGLFDIPLKTLGGSTPLEKANCPNLDEIAQLGQWIKVEPPIGGLENSLLELFGLESSKTHLSQSSLEVYSKKCPFKSNQCAFLFQLISLYEDQVILMDKDLLKESELALFCADLNDYFGSWAHFIPLGNSGGVCIINEMYESTESLKIPADFMGLKYTQLLPAFFKKNRRLEKIEELHRFLEKHSLNLVRQDFEESVCNGLYFYEAGAPLNAIVSKEFYKRFCLYSPSSPSQGLSNLLQIKQLQIQNPSPLLYLEELISLSQEALNNHKTIVLELHEILESTLHGNLLEKIKRIEYLDRHLLGPLMDLCKASHTQLIVSPLKHSNTQTKTLTEGSVPWIVFNPRHRKALEPILSLKESELNRIKGHFTIRSLAAQFLY
ncbi:MAG: 2,3-bisphosphoglycerate-independent phosphoglycerate mutase [Chlamydiae bacterium]|nr:2,3-bisphosphoglycerate-independent phosphoglycerate mutase [Chlamydiota bacterium]